MWMQVKWLTDGESNVPDLGTSRWVEIARRAGLRGNSPRSL